MKYEAWKKYQEEVLIPFYRDELEITYCENCGSEYALSFHHLIRRSAGGQNEKSNIMLLCATCHHKADNATGHVEYNTLLCRKAEKRPFNLPNYFASI